MCGEKFDMKPLFGSDEFFDHKGSKLQNENLCLDAETSRLIFDRTGGVKRIVAAVAVSKFVSS
jgi:hypothetical protein